MFLPLSDSFSVMSCFQIPTINLCNASAMLLWRAENYTDKTQVVINLNFPSCPMCPLSDNSLKLYIPPPLLPHGHFCQGHFLWTLLLLADGHLEYFGAKLEEFSYLMRKCASVFTSSVSHWAQDRFSLTIVFCGVNNPVISVSSSFVPSIYYVVNIVPAHKSSNRLGCGANLPLFDMKTNRRSRAGTPVESYMHLLWGRTRTAVYLLCLLLHHPSRVDLLWFKSR